MKEDQIHPFLRWAGGKNWLLKYIEDYLPENFNNYHELFLGGASLFTFLSNRRLLNKKIYFSDTNRDLVTTYINIRDNVESVILYLKNYKNKKESYYHLRNKVITNKIELAARFIYLNRTSYNGIYRVNLKGKYNVPYGFKKYKALFDFDNLLKFSKRLKGVEIFSKDFEESLENIKKNDLVFLDPPYTTAHQDNGFIKYNQKLFSLEDQKRLSIFMEKISKVGAHFISTNSYHKNIIKIFSKHKKKKLKRFSVIGGKEAERKIISELIFFNTKN